MTQGPRVIFCSSLCAPLPLRATESAQNRPKRCDFERLRVSCPSPFALRATGSAENRPKRCDFGWLGFFPVCLCPFATPRRPRGGRVGGRLFPSLRFASLPTLRCLSGAARRPSRREVGPSAVQALIRSAPQPLSPSAAPAPVPPWRGGVGVSRCGARRARGNGGPMDRVAPVAPVPRGLGGPGDRTVSVARGPRCPGGPVGRWTGWPRWVGVRMAPVPRGLGGSLDRMCCRLGVPLAGSAAQRVKGQRGVECCFRFLTVTRCTDSLPTRPVPVSVMVMVVLLVLA